MIGRHRDLLVAALAILAVVVNALWLVPMRDDLGDARLALGLLVAVAFATAGAVAMRIRPGNPTGAAMLVVALLVNLGEANFEADLPWRFTVGMVLEDTAPPLLACLALSFPTGRVRGWWAWLLCLTLVGLMAFIVVARALWVPPAPFCWTCPPAGNVLFTGPAPFDVLVTLDHLRVPFAVLVSLALATLLVRWVRATRPARRVLGPVLLTTVLLTAKVSIDQLVLVENVRFDAFVDQRHSLVYPNQLLTALIPLAFLVAVVRSEFGRSPLARLLADVVDEDAPVRVDRALAAALGDRSLCVGYRAAGAEGFVDIDGDPVELPGPGAARTATFVRDANDVVIVHDAALSVDPRQLEGAVAAAAMALRRERLLAALQLRLRQLTDSRARLLRAGEDQRRRIQVALDGAVEVRLAELWDIVEELRRRLTDARARQALDAVSADIERAREDLRALVRGLRPPVLVAEGLDAALSALAQDAAVPVSVVRAPRDRLPGEIEAAVWFLCSETIVNVAKYARATRAEVDVRIEDGTLRVEVADDGAGGAAEAHGSGLRGLRERVETLGGAFTVISPLGKGTTVRADLPLATAGSARAGS